MISNPVKFGYCESEKQFTYEGGKQLFHFSPHDNNLSTTMENNLIFFADDETHALKVLEKMFKFTIKHAVEEKGVFSKGTSERFSEYLTALRAGKLKVKPAPMNQFYEVGWASNDTVH